MRRFFLAGLLAAGLQSCGSEPVRLRPNPVQAEPSSTSEASAAVAPDVTWYAHIAPLVEVHCVACHQRGGLAGDLDLTDLEVAQAWSSKMAQVVEDRLMPPFGADTDAACPQPWGWVDDRRLTDHEIERFTRWDLLGAPGGDPDQTVEGTPREEPELDRVDTELRLPRPSAIPPLSEASDVYVCALFDPALDAVGWLEGVAVAPGNRRVVHHVGIAVVDREEARDADEADGRADGLYPCHQMGLIGDDLAGYAPGMGPMVFPPGSGFEVGTEQVFAAQIHYHAVDAAQVDDTRIQLQWALTPPAKRVLVKREGTALDAARGLFPGEDDRNGVPEFHIPAGREHHDETMLWLPALGQAEAEVVAILGHMHLAGTAFEAWIVHADGTRGDCLLSIPRYDFDWQLFYLLDTPRPVLRPGDHIHRRCTYDNSEGNEALARARAEQGMNGPRDIGYGRETTDEMCSIFVTLVQDI